MRFILLLLVIIINNLNILYANERPYQFKDVGVTNTIGVSIEENIYFTDEFDKTVNIKDLINNKPTIINFVYLNCPLLCHLLLDGMTDIIMQTKYKMPEDYQVISISIDPRETNQNLKNYKKKYHSKLKINNGWLFLKGRESQIEKLTSILGYNYKYIARTKDYSHPSVIYFYNKKLTNYIEGITFNLNAFNYSLINSTVNKTIGENIITYCYYFDPDSQTYSLLIFKILRILCLITVIILTFMIIYFLRKEKKQRNYG